MNKKSTSINSVKQRPSTRSLTTTSTTPKNSIDKYTFQSDDDTEPTNKSKSPIKRSRGRPPKAPRTDQTPQRPSISSSNIESDSEIEENTSNKRKRSGEKILTGKKRGRKSKMLNSIDNDLVEDKSKMTNETENIVPPASTKRRYIKKKSLSTDTNSKNDQEELDDSQIKLSNVDEKDLMQFGSPQHQTQSQVNNQSQLLPTTQLDDDDFSDDSVEFVWKGSSKMSIEILKRRIPKDEPRDHSSIQSDPTAQRKRAIIPRLTNFDALSGQPTDTSNGKRSINENSEQNPQKKSSSVITLNNVFQNDFVPSYNDTGAKMTTTTTAASTPHTTAAGTEDKPRPRIYAVKSTTMKARQQQQQQPEIKRPKWMNDQQGKSDEEDDEDNLPPPGEEPDDFDYVPKGQYTPKRANYRGRGTYPARRGTGLRGRPPGVRRQYHDDDDDDDYDQYEDMNSRYGPRKQTAYRTSRPMYDSHGGDNDDDYDKTRRISLTQAYRRNTAVRPTMSSMTGQRRIAISNGNNPIYKDEDYYQQQTRPTTTSTTNPSGNTFVTKINDTQLNDVSNQSQIFFVNVPQQEQKNQQQQQQQQVLPVTLVQQVKLPTDAPKQKKILPKPSATNSTGDHSTAAANAKPFAWSRPPGRIQSNTTADQSNQNLNTDLDTMEAAHVLATAADVTMANDAARRKAQQNDDDMTMMVDETPSNIAGEETIQCDENTAKNLLQQQMGTITANIIDENGVEHTVLLSTEEAQQLLGTQGAIIVDSDGQPISIQQAQPQTFISPFALDQAQLQALLVQAGLDPNTPLTIEQVDPNQQQQVATLCTSPGGTQYTVLTQGPTQQQFILQTANEPAPVVQAPLPPVQPQAIAPKEEILSSPPTKRRAFAVKSTTRAEPFDDPNANDRPRRKIFATKSTVTQMNDELTDDQEGFIGTRAYHRSTTRK